jgi:hypothetical protein
MSCADQASVAVSENDDHRRRGERAELKQDEDGVMAMQRQRADEQTARQPHRPCACAHPRRAMLSREVNDLGDVRQHRDGDPNDTQNFEHSALRARTLSFAEGASLKLVD